MQLDEASYRNLENELLKLCKDVAIPRFVKALRNAIELDLMEQFQNLPKGVQPSMADFKQEFVDWISYGNLNTNFETKALNNYPATRQIEDWEEGITRDPNGHAVREISDEDIPF